MIPTQNLNVREVSPLLSPKALKTLIPMSEGANQTVIEGRETVKKILSKQDPRLLVVVGPCSIHDPDGARDYAKRLRKLKMDLNDHLFLLMRVYFEKPRTTVGWKGLINDPHLDGSCDLEAGLKKARALFLEINELGLPTATEFLDPIIPQYTSDLVSWAAIGARTTESQTHRELASGLSMPIGFKNGTDGSFQAAIDAMISAKTPHYFLGIDERGATCVIKTKGNSWSHLVLRGGRVGANYDPKSLKEATHCLSKTGLPPVLMVDCSHANSAKQHARQEMVWKSLIQQRLDGNEDLVGIMVESYLKEGSQPFPQDPKKLAYGISITDPCLGWETTEAMLRTGAWKLGKKE